MNGVLTIGQSTSTARIFLNIFGFVLDDVDDINEDSIVRIFDKNKNVVGQLRVRSDKVEMNVSNGNCDLSASYTIPKFSGFNDGGALFTQWAGDVEYLLKRSNDAKLSGSITIDCTMDSEFGIRCNCHPLVVCEYNEKENISLKILRDGRTFSLRRNLPDEMESIDILPWDDLNGFIIHDIKRGEKVGARYQYRRYAGVFKCVDHDDMLRVFSMEEKDGGTSFHNGHFKKVSTSEGSSELLIQKGLLMQKIDPSMFELIGNLREKLMIGDVSLFDNLVSVCYDSYTDEEIKALLNVERRVFSYQDGTDNLISSYYGIDKNNFFGVTEKQKIMLKSKIKTTN